MGKRKGEMLELYQNPLCEIPIPKFSEADQKKIVSLTTQLISNPEDAKAFDKVNDVIFEAVGVTKPARSAIEKLYDLRKAAFSAGQEGELEEDEAA